MSYKGRVRNGVIVLDPPAALPEGAEVDVVCTTKAEEAAPSWGEVLKDLIGKAEGLPSDSSVNHDHYLYGTPKR